MRIGRWLTALLVMLALALPPAVAQQFSPDQRAFDLAGSTGTQDQEKVPDEPGQNAFKDLLNLFSGRAQRTGAEGGSCTWDSCPGDMQCCCCGDRCVCKKECSFQPCR